MSEVLLDCKGLPCPQPVLRCKESIEKDSPDTLKVVVDNEAAKSNVTRFLGTQGYEVEALDQGGVWELSAQKAAGAEASKASGIQCDCEEMSDAQLAQLASKICVFLTADTLGKGDDELGGKLMLNFLATLPELGDELWRVVMVNGAVKMSVAGHPVLEHLKKIEDMGVDILVCGTCLDHFKLLDKREVGETTNMLDVVTSLQLATKVIKP